MMSAEPVNGADAAWLRLDSPSNLLVITALAATETMSLAAFREVVAQRFLSFQRFRYRPALHSGMYFWEDHTEFALEQHVIPVSLPAPGNKASLETFVSEMMSTPLPADRPLWQFLFIERYQGGSAVIMRVHHCYADGLSLVAVFGTLTDATPVAQWSQPEIGHEGRSRHLSQRFSQGLRGLIRSAEKATRLQYRMEDPPTELLGCATRPAAWQTGLEGVAELVRLAALPGDPATFLKPGPGVLKHCAWTGKVPLETFKAVADALGCRINDVLVSIVCAGLRRELVKRQTIHPDGLLHATLPVNLRALEEELEVFPLGNQFGTVFVPLSVGLQNPLERLYKTKHDMISLKQSSLPLWSHWVMGLTGMLPRGWQAPVLDLFSNKTSLVLSNVPGSRTHRFLAGRKVHELMFWVPQAGDLCLGVSLLSYAGSVQLGVSADVGLAMAPRELLDAMLAELQAYCDLARVGNVKES